MVCDMTATAPLNIPSPASAAYLGNWELSDNERIAQRWFRCGERRTPGGLRVKVHGIQYVDGGVDELSIALSDKDGDVVLDADDVEHLAEELRAAAKQLRALKG